MKSILTVLLCWIAFCSLANAQSFDTLKWERGHYSSWFSNVNLNIYGTPGPYAVNQELVWFRPASPVTLKQVQIYIHANQPDTVTLVVWKSSGGDYYPYLDSEWYSQELIVTKGNAWDTVALPNIVLDQPYDFFVGIKRHNQNAGIGYTVDAPYAKDYGIGGYYSSSWVEANYKGHPVPIAPSQVTGYGNKQFMVRVIAEAHEAGINKLFTDVATKAGLGGISSSRIAWGDIDNDGWPDLMVQNRIFRNNHDGTFKEIDDTLMRQEPVITAIFADIDNDGYQDILFASDDTTKHGSIWKNNGNLTFTKLPETHFADTGGAQCLALADYDGDGRLDVFMGCRTNFHADASGNDIQFDSYLYHNKGGFQYEDATSHLQGYQTRATYNASWGDYDNDGWPDLYQGTYLLNPDFLWHNEHDGTFTDQADATGVIGHAKPNYPGTYGHGIGSGWADYDNNGYLDLLVANLAHPRNEYDPSTGQTINFASFSDRTELFHNQGPEFSYSFEDVAQKAGIQYEETHTDVAWGDFDNDGLLDFYITAVYPGRFSSMYHQLPDHTFRNVTYETGTKGENNWGCAWADFDHDGLLDLATDSAGVLKLYHNNGRTNNHRIQIKCVGDISKKSNRDGIGSRVTVFAGFTHYMREITEGRGSGSQDPNTAFIGLGSVSAIDSIVIRWPNRETSTYKNIAADHYYVATESAPGLTSLEQYSGVTSPKPLTSISQLLPSIPNPFRPATTIRAHLDKRESIRIDILDEAGRLVRTLFDGIGVQGLNIFTWNGANSGGDRVVVGPYMVRLTTSAGVSMQKILLAP